MFSVSPNASVLSLVVCCQVIFILISELTSYCFVLRPICCLVWSITVVVVRGSFCISGNCSSWFLLFRSVRISLDVLMIVDSLCLCILRLLQALCLPGIPPVLRGLSVLLILYHHNVV